MKYRFTAIEKKWQKKWEDARAFQVKENSKKKKFYVLHMFPYPSGSGLHMGHAFNYTITDIIARMKRMQGFNVLFPVGYDSLGLPAENAAIESGVHPKKYTEKAISNFMKQEKSLGLSYDWSRLIITHEPEYYKWDQWIFLKMFEKGLVYRKKSPVNYCEKCKTVLANEQVHNGKCWRHTDTDVQIKNLEQWFLKITDYADELYDKIDKLDDWPERIKIMQKNWINKSHGTEILFDINGKKSPIFTTRPDTIFGVSFLVVSSQHPKLFEIVTSSQKKEVEKFLKKINSVSQKPSALAHSSKESQMSEKEILSKDGVFTGSYAINPANNEKVPIWVGNFVLADYGSGIVMGVPAHDQRDFEFAKKYKLLIREVIKPSQVQATSPKLGQSKGGDINKSAYEGDGMLINSGNFNGLNSREAKEHITKFLESKKLGKKAINFKLKDWLISRQRYWGAPIPIVYCDECGIVPISEKELPVKLPEKVDFGKGNPLETAESWLNVKCPKCGNKARRETDTMDTFANSSWYYLRYCDSKNRKQIFDKKKIEYWMPIDIYIGGAEHACMHLIYFRFYTKFLRDLKLLKFGEPALRLFNQGMLHGEDGHVMSKSRGNIVVPETISKKYGIDTARLFLMSVSSPDKDTLWSDKGIQGSSRFIKKVMDYFENVKFGNPDSKTESKLNKTIKQVTESIDDFKFNLAVIKIREFFEKLPAKTDKEILKDFLKMFSIFCPHVAEELWEQLGNKNLISLSSWPKPDEKKINKQFEIEDELIDKVVNDINNIFNIVKSKKKNVKKVFIYVIPKDKEVYVSNLNEISKRTSLDVKIFSVSDKNKYDPKSKSKNAKPGKPGIYLE